MKIADLGLLVSAALVALLCCGRAEDDPQSTVPGDGILALNGSNYDLLRSNQDAEWIILFYADWCGACRAFKPAFHQFSDWARTNAAHVKVAAANYENSTILMTRFFITRLPTVVHVKNGEYRVLPFPLDLQAVIRDETWRDIAPNKSWLAPFSFACNMLGWIASIGQYFAVWMEKAYRWTGIDPVWLVALMGAGLISIFALITFIEGLVGTKRQVADHPKKD